MVASVVVEDNLLVEAPPVTAFVPADPSLPFPDPFGFRVLRLDCLSLLLLRLDSLSLLRLVSLLSLLRLLTHMSHHLLRSLDCCRHSPRDDNFPVSCSPPMAMTRNRLHLSLVLA